MADSFNKKEREKKRKKRKKEKRERKQQRKEDGSTQPEFMYVDQFGNLSPTPPDPNKKREISVDDIDISTPKKGEYEEELSEVRGRVKFFNEEKGYGFILEAKTKKSYFVHTDQLKEPIRDHDKVVFEKGQGPKGPVALNVRLAQ